MWGSFNNWNIIKLSHKVTSSEEIDKIHQVVLYGTSENMSELAQTDKYGAINKIYKDAMGNYMIELILETYTIQE